MSHFPDTTTLRTLLTEDSHEKAHAELIRLINEEVSTKDANERAAHLTAIAYDLRTALNNHYADFLKDTTDRIEHTRRLKNDIATLKQQASLREDIASGEST